MLHVGCEGAAETPFKKACKDMSSSELHASSVQGHRGCFFIDVCLLCVIHMLCMAQLVPILLEQVFAIKHSPFLSIVTAMGSPRPRHRSESTRFSDRGRPGKAMADWTSNGVGLPWTSNGFWLLDI